MYSIHLVSGQQYGGFHMGGHDPKRMFGSSQRDQRDKEHQDQYGKLGPVEEVPLTGN